MADPLELAARSRELLDASAPPLEGEPSMLDQLRAALITTDGLDDIPEPQPLIAGVLYRDSLAWLIGPPGHGKSFVALDIAGSVATGLPWQGHAVTAGAVLYVVAEGLSGMRPRVRAWEAAAGEPMKPTFFLPVAVQAASPSGWSALIDLAAELRPALVVLDTQARITVGLEENAARDMGLFVHAADRLRTATRACVLTVHHQGRSGEHMRGSTALEGAASTIMRVAKDGDLITLSCAKQKDDLAFDDIALRLVPRETSVIVCLTDPSHRDHVLSGQTGVLATHWWNIFETRWVSASRLIDAVPVPRTSVYRGISGLVRAGYAEDDGAKTRTLYRLRSDPSLRVSQGVS